MNKSFGSDPELLLIDNNEQPFSAIDVIKGDSANRITILNHQFYYDNVLAECAIKPSYSKQETIENFRECFKIYTDLVKPLKLKPQASTIFSDVQLDNQIAKIIGCVPDWCAYKIKMIKPPKEFSSNLRSCGGHIHLGSKMLAGDDSRPLLLIYMLDLFIGIPSLWLDKDPTSPRRRQLYGKAGRYRPKDYGLEYRSLSNFWLQSPKMVSLIYDICMFVHDFVEDGRAWKMWSFDEDVFYSSNTLSDAWQCHAYDITDLQKSINQSDKTMALPIFKLAREAMPSFILKELDELIESNVKNDFYENWELKLL